MIRKACQAQHTLDFFLTAHCEKFIRQRGLYQEMELQFPVNEWKQHCWQLEQQMEAEAWQIFQNLQQRKLHNLPYRFALIETSCAGKISSVLGGISGISHYFMGGQIAYSYSQQKRLLGHSCEDLASVSEQMVQQLAKVYFDTMDVDWVLAETGVAGPISSQQRSRKNGQCYFAIASSVAMNEGKDHSLQQKTSQSIFE